MSPKVSGPGIPAGEVLAGFSKYADALQLVEKLVENDFPAKSISIVGTDLKSVELIRGKLGYGRVSISGAVTGTWIGLFLGLILGGGAESTEAQLVSNIGAGIVIGAGIGMLFNIIRFSLTKNKRNFISTQSVVAKKYEVIVPTELLANAKTAIQEIKQSSKAKKTS